MALTVHLPSRFEQELTEYCVKRGLSTSEAMKLALEQSLRAPAAGPHDSRHHPFIGSDKGDGSDVSGGIHAALRARFRGTRTHGRP